MNITYSVFGIKTGLIRQGDNISGCLLDAIQSSDAGAFKNGDILIIAESALATAEGRIIKLDSIKPAARSRSLAECYSMDPRLVEVVIRESDRIIGGIDGFLLCMKNGTLLPNAGIDASNAPHGCIVLLPEDPDGSAASIRRTIEECCSVKIGVVIADSRTHAMRVGCSGVAIGCSGIPSVLDERGRVDLYGRELQVTKQALADNIASAAEIVMGEADECIPAAVLRGLGLSMTNESGIEGIEAGECLFMGTFLGRENNDNG